MTTARKSVTQSLEEIRFELAQIKALLAALPQQIDTPPKMAAVISVANGQKVDSWNRGNALAMSSESLTRASASPIAG